MNLRIPGERYGFDLKRYCRSQNQNSRLFGNKADCGFLPAIPDRLPPGSCFRLRWQAVPDRSSAQKPFA